MKAELRAALAAAILVAAPASTSAAPTYPPTRVEVVRDTLHGAVIEDPYRWLEDKNSPETKAWVRAQMAYTQEQLEHVPGRDKVVSTLARFAKVDARGLPKVSGQRLFFTARSAEQQQAALVMREGPDGPDVVLVDPNPLSPDHTVSVSLTDVSLDGSLVAYALRKGGEDEIEVRLLDVATKKERPGLPKARYFSVSIDKAKQGCWYTRWESAGSRLWYHRFGDEPSRDRLVFGEKLGPTQIPFASLSGNGRWLSIGVAVGPPFSTFCT